MGRGTLAAKNRESLRYSSPLTPGQTYQITWSLEPAEYLLKSGHRLGLVLAGTNPSLSGADVPTGATVSVDLAASMARVPVVPYEAG
jgi:X-Pro dipeptidyl-peptidase